MLHLLGLDHERLTYRYSGRDFRLTDVYGPRLTNSPGFRKAGDWAVKEMTSWGLTNVTLAFDAPGLGAVTAK